MIRRLLPSLLGLVLCLGTARGSDDVAEQSHVVVPDGIFGSMRKVDSETLVLPDASAVMRRQQQRTAAQEARERAAQRVEAARLSAPTGDQAAGATSTPVAADPEATLVEESVQAATAVEEPSTDVAVPAPAPEPEPTADPEPSPAGEVAPEQE